MSRSVSESSAYIKSSRLLPLLGSWKKIARFLDALATLAGGRSGLVLGLGLKGGGSGSELVSSIAGWVLGCSVVLFRVGGVRTYFPM